ncbi:hypothetical protein E3T28_00090 [Cryobacterium sinapicolor]|uniref:Integral membrane protein n=1 Tax=Cryobacterium sinapicolor TaxID=1259236 RepID=A0ABY2JJY0_9MICO|nr:MULTISPECIES: hypothetical protein [Cryobacterium]TFC90120.1 hypothetical protein E3O67_06095 [Cryobacterium sp. TMT3-29-2]TFD06339.1 hypothetical protein E3T28_00090 [Cryobacterium sinapicolor]
MDQTGNPETESTEAALARLVNENVRLRELLDAAETDAAASAETVPLPGLAAAIVPPPSRQRWRAFLAVVLIAFGVLLAPVAVVSQWTRNVVTDTDTFVATVAPLAEDPAFQAFLVTEIVTVVEEQVDIEALTTDLFDGLAALDLPPRAQNALALLEGPAVEGVRSLVRTSAERVVASDAFATVWEESLRLSQTQIISALEGDTSSALVISDTGEVGIQLGPIIAEVKQQLVAQGFGLAADIPDIDRTIPIAQSDALVQARTAYQLLTVAGTVLPWVSLLLIAAGVLVSRRRSLALIWAGLTLGLSMALLALGVSVGRFFAVNALSPEYLPSDLAGTVYDSVVPLVYASALSVGLAAITVAIVAYLGGPFRGAIAVRRLVTDGCRHLRASAARSGVTTGRFGLWLYRARRFIRAAVGIGAAAVAIFWRPLTPAVIIWTAVLALIVVLLIELLQRPPGEVAPVPAAAAEAGPTEPAARRSTSTSTTADLTETAELPPPTGNATVPIGAGPIAAGPTGAGAPPVSAPPVSRDDAD